MLIKLSCCWKTEIFNTNCTNHFDLIVMNHLTLELFTCFIFPPTDFNEFFLNDLSRSFENDNLDWLAKQLDVLIKNECRLQ